MGKHVVFMVHGMGDHDENWADSSINLLGELYEQYEQLSLFVSFEERFEFVPIRYDQFFDELRTQWGNDAKPVLDLLKAGKLQPGAHTELTKIAAAPSVDGFLTTHLLDVFLYRFIPQVGERVRRHVAGEILKKLQSGPGPWHWSILGHSLGTSVVHDTLHQLFTDAATGPAMRKVRAKLVMMISNVSRLLEKPGMDVYRTVTHPSLDPLEGTCGYYYNARHESDPFPRPREFRPADDWPDPVTRSQGRFQKVEINAFAGKNVHSLDHYLGNPKIHVPFFRLLSTPELIPDATFAEAVAKYEASTPIGALENLRRKLKSLQLQDQATWQQALKAFNKFFEILREF